MNTTRPRLLLICAAFLALSIGSTTSVSLAETSPPEEVVLSYLNAFNDITFEKTTEFLHPELLSKFKENIKATLIKSDAEGQRDLLQECGVRSIAEIDQVPDKEFYSRRLRNYWNIDSEEKKRRYQEMMQRISYKILSTEELSFDKYQVTVNSIISIGEVSTVKKHVYSLVKFNTDWKIWDIAITDG